VSAALDWAIFELNADTQFDVSPAKRSVITLLLVLPAAQVQKWALSLNKLQSTAF
jgi:hypothetical protein